MRGAEANHTLVFIDGVRANDPAQNGEFNFAHLLNADIEAVEVIRGPQSALWGSDALAGVINIRTRRGGDGLAGSVYAEGGENSWQNLGANARYGNEQLRAALGIASIETDGDNISRAGGEDDGYENTTLTGSFDWSATETLTLEGSLRHVDANNDYDEVDFSTGLPADSNSETDTEQLYGRLGATLSTLDGRWRHSASITLTDTENDNRGQFSRTRTEAEVIVYTLQTSFDLAEGHTLTGAYERWEEDFTQRGMATDFGDPNRDEDIDTDAFILEYRGQLTDTLSVLASARNDDNSDFDDKTTGRLSAAWQVADATTLRGAWGTGIKNPTFTERFGFFTNFVGNPDLKPEESTGWEIGVDQNWLDDRLQVSATWFDEELEDEINGFFFDPTIGEFGDFTAVNEDGKSERQGLELAVRWPILDGLSLNAAYTWLDSQDPDGSDEIRRAEHIASANLNWDFLAGRANLNLQLDYNGEQDDFFFPPVPPFQERVELDSFTLVTLAGSYRLLESLELYARVENATDEDYEEVFGFVAPGRTAIAGVRYSFGR
jgi:vitamin B12 transporter